MNILLEYCEWIYLLLGNLEEQEPRNERLIALRYEHIARIL